ncbi:MAG: redoxin domain-containing protein [Archangium sp.]|nr:redoxin domain-containing protein [Archangium sp.]
MASSDSRHLLLVAVLLAGCATSHQGRGLEHATLVSTTRQSATARELVEAADGTVFVFWSGGCPCVRRYQARIEALAAEWSERGIAFVQVSSNAGESLESLTANVRTRGLKLPVWRDDDGALAEALEAKSTPTAVFVARDGSVLYRGWIDNERAPGEDGREAWLESALNGFVTHRPFAARSPTWGCTITRALGRAAAPHCQQPMGEQP